jgi:hypothetical protein
MTSPLAYAASRLLHQVDADDLTVVSFVPIILPKPELGSQI